MHNLYTIENALYHYLSQKGGYPDLVATSGDYLRVWRVSDSDVRLECLLNNVRLLTVFGLNNQCCYLSMLNVFKTAVACKLMCMYRESGIT